jgi:exopolyphosphatase/guanosine-5'-triphosphate,3'-diphosphate pyrophosphatase
MTSPTNRNIAIFDIGSNAVRMTLYRLGKGSIEVVTKAVELCEMGRPHSVPNTLYPPGVDKAYKALGHFNQIIRKPQSRADGVVAVATEAIRSATDGPTFIKRLNDDLGLSVQIITPVDEGRYGAQGVLYSLPHADGLVADLGGGSLQITRVGSGVIGETTSLPLGTLRALDHRDNLETWLEPHWPKIPPALQKADHLYVIGGSWRALAKLYMARSGADTRDVQGLALDAHKLAALSGFLTKQPLETLRPSLVNDYHLEAARVDSMVVAAPMLLHLIKATGATKITVSSAGVRDGLIRAVALGTLTPAPVPTRARQTSIT